MMQPVLKTKAREIAENYIMPLNLFEFGDYVYYDEFGDYVYYDFVYRYVLPDDVLMFSFIGSKKNDYQALFNKSEGIINDLDGGPNILPRTIKDDNTIIGLIDALQLKNYVSSETFRNSVARYPEKKKELEQPGRSLKETDNPVLILAGIRIHNADHQ